MARIDKEVISSVLSVADKKVIGNAVWQRDNRKLSKFRIRWLVECASSLVMLEITTIVFPRIQEEVRNNFTLILIVDNVNVARLEFGDKELLEHKNVPKDKIVKRDRLPIIVRGSHVHFWADNVHLPLSELADLKVARCLPDWVVNFDEALRYFCDNVGIEMASVHIPAWPEGGLL